MNFYLSGCFKFITTELDFEKSKIILAKTFF
jgi:hypothetical protein